MKYNILLQSANLAADVKNPGNLLLMLELVDNPKIPDVRILAASLSPFTVGYMIGELLSILQLPSLNHIQRVPATLDIEGNSWTLVNFLDENRQFNIDTINKQLTDAINPPADAATSSDATTSDTSAPSS